MKRGNLSAWLHSCSDEKADKLQLQRAVIDKFQLMEIIIRLSEEFRLRGRGSVKYPKISLEKFNQKAHRLAMRNFSLSLLHFLMRDGRDVNLMSVRIFQRIRINNWSRKSLSESQDGTNSTKFEKSEKLVRSFRDERILFWGCRTGI